MDTSKDLIWFCFFVLSVKREEKSEGRNQFGGNAASSADPRCPFKHPLFFLISPRVQPPHPSAHQVANQISSYLRSKPPVPLVYRCVPGRHLGQTARQGGTGADPVVSSGAVTVIGGGWSGSRSHVSSLRGKLIPKPQDRWLQRHLEKWERSGGRLSGGHSAKVWDEKQGAIQESHRGKLVFTQKTFLLNGFVQSALSGEPTRSLSNTGKLLFISLPG